MLKNKKWKTQLKEKKAAEETRWIETNIKLDERGEKKTQLDDEKDLDKNTDSRGNFDWGRRVAAEWPT